MGEQRSDLASVVYTSRAVGRFGDDDLAALLEHSRRNNARLGLSGMLLYRERSFLQVLEGPWLQVWDRMSFIEADPRHSDVTILIADRVHERQFAEWSMAFPYHAGVVAESAPGYRSTFDDLYASAHPSRAGGALRELTRWYQERMHETAAPDA